MKNSKDLKSYKANIKSYFKEIVNQYAEKYPYYIMTETLKKAYRVYFTKKFEHLISNEQIEDVYNNPWMSYNATEYIADINRHIYNEWLKMHITRLIKNSNKDNMIDVVTNNIFETFECWPK